MPISQQEHFEFVKSLAAELNSREIKLTSFPDVVMRVRKALDHPDTTSANLATILSVDPALASRILVLANSAYYNTGGIRIQSLDAAVGRIGFATVRATAISYAVEQLHSSDGLGAMKSELAKSWSSTLRLAAMSEVIARNCSNLNADNAFIAGLLNQIGVLYIFTKYEQYPKLLHDPDSRQNLIDEWTAPIGETIVANWDFTEDIVATLNPSEEEIMHTGGEATLVDVVAAAKAALSPHGTQSCVSSVAHRLRLADEIMPEIQKMYQQRLDSLASAVR